MSLSRRKLYSRWMTCIAMVISCSSAAAAQANTVVELKGKLVHFDNQAVLEDVSELQNLLPPSRSGRTIALDASGHFSITFTLPSPTYFRLGRNVLYLTPGDDLKVSIDQDDPNKALFQGRGSAANSYLRQTPFPHAGSYLAAGTNLGRTPTETLSRTMTAARARQAELNAVGAGVSAQFRRLERARIRADVINSLNAAVVYAGHKLKGDDLQGYLASYKKVTDPVKKSYEIGFVDASFLRLAVYRDICAELLQLNPGAKDGRKVADWIKANAVANGIQTLSDKKQIAAHADEVNTISTPEYRAALRLQLDQLLKFGKGDAAVDFSATDPDGRKVTLSSLEGKVIYVDIWASWCVPCLEEMPAYERLRDGLKDNKDIALVSLSIDDSAVAWRKNLNARKAVGNQWHINRSDLEAYNIVGIPRSLVIDRDFRVVEMNGPLPSSAQLQSALVNLVTHRS